jgi:sulfopropanediol 3-dehydrogenase
MKVIKNGGHRLFEKDPETVRIVSEMLLNLERHGMDAVRRYSQKFDDLNPASFELSGSEVPVVKWAR